MELRRTIPRMSKQVPGISPRTTDHGPVPSRSEHATHFLPFISSATISATVSPSVSPPGISYADTLILWTCSGYFFFFRAAVPGVGTVASFIDSGRHATPLFLQRLGEALFWLHPLVWRASRVTFETRDLPGLARVPGWRNSDDGPCL